MSPRISNSTVISVVPIRGIPIKTANVKRTDATAPLKIDEVNSMSAT